MTFAKSCHFALLAGALLSSCTTSPPVPPSRPDAVAYRVSPVMKADGRIDALHVEVSFRVEADGSTLVLLPAQSEGQTELWRNLSSLAVRGGELATTDDPAERLVTAAPGASVTFSYLVRSGLDHTPTGADQQPYAPWIVDDWFFVDGGSFFVRPQLPRDTPATFAWDGDRSLVFASNLENLSALASGGTLQDITGSTMLGGRDMRIFSRGHTRLALRGKFGFADSDLLDGVARVLETERRFWGDPPDAPYLVAMATTAPEPGVRGSFAGSSHGDAFSAVVSGDVDLPNLLSSLFAHEVLHTWMPGVLGDTRAAPDGEAWFGEGFTDYYARALMLREGVISLDEFVDLWNRALREYMVSPARNLSNEKITEGVLTSFDASRMPYLRGAVFAALIDGRLRSASDGRTSLDDILLLQRKRAAGARQGPPLAANSLTALFTAITRESGSDVSGDLAAFIDRGETIILSPGAFGPCLRVEQTTVPAYDRGFDLEASTRAGMIATGVRPDGRAWRAGLRDGMRLVRLLEGRLGDSTHENFWLVESNGEEKTIRWLPAGDGEVPIQRLVRVLGAPAEPSRCGLD